MLIVASMFAGAIWGEAMIPGLVRGIARIAVLARHPELAHVRDSRVPYLDRRGAWIVNNATSPAIIIVDGSIKGAVPPGETVLVSCGSSNGPEKATVEIIVASMTGAGTPCGVRIEVSGEAVGAGAPILLAWGPRGEATRAPDPLSTRALEPSANCEWALALLPELRGDTTTDVRHGTPAPARTPSRCELLDLVVFPPHSGTHVNSIGSKFVLVPANSFVMGSARGDATNRPHQVALSNAYWIGVTEVTQAQWREVMGTNPSKFKGDDRPVDSVSHGDAVQFCDRLSAREGRRYRLPTEAEWECACRAGATAMFHWGDEVGLSSRFAWTNENARERTHPVAKRSPNAWGIHDMGGNVVEWCSDWFSWRYPTVPVTDPTGPSQGDEHVRRGGFWGFYPFSCGSASRDSGPVGFAEPTVGLRVVLEVEAGSEAPDVDPGGTK